MYKQVHKKTKPSEKYDKEKKWTNTNTMNNRNKL